MADKNELPLAIAKILVEYTDENICSVRKN